ncbi:hypothetical protein MFS40622_1822 [Methanocaldococcus sp. FS406-22]|uniref:hypothetical protein n=1 Tax=Methanocaldococcus sp. (strain FS406-22) TaxID=644281 RepID=UPI0001BF2F73|nr:hypothetical protein [Methanocaldococcus sp. FS406-22]ADC70492.1 hypothetical protein MFS40622_1822 [Methanocaldococcus sp. FS406-22]
MKIIVNWTSVIVIVVVFCFLIVLGIWLLLFGWDVEVIILGGHLTQISVWMLLLYLLWFGYIYTNTKNNIIEYFSACPICESPNILVKLSWGFSINDTHEVVCQDCGAKWLIKTSGWTGKIKTVKLVKPSDNGTGQEYLGKETDPEFWISIARKRKQD